MRNLFVLRAYALYVRHVFATTGIAVGVSIETVCKTLEHKDLKTTMIYAKVLDEVKIKEMQKWNNL